MQDLRGASAFAHHPVRAGSPQFPSNKPRALNRDSGIVNDPNGWFEDPRDLIAAVRRIVQVSVETVAVVESLPCPFSEPNVHGGRP